MKSKLEDKNWVIKFMTEWVEKNTKFKVKVIELTKKQEVKDEPHTRTREDI